MISIEESIPIKNENFRAGEDIFYVQFNDISFYIEDEEQENFFFCILKKLFTDIKIEKIFPLGGKYKVIEESNQCIGNYKKVFIVDKDFDDILEKINNNPNLFYLERYSIENHLLEKKSIIEYIIGEKPKLRKKEINDNFDYEKKLSHICSTLKNLVHLHLIVQQNCPQIKNTSLNHEKFIHFNDGVFTIKQNELIKYQDDVKAELAKTDRRKSLNAQLRRFQKRVSLSTIESGIKHIPGKYLVKMLKQLIESSFRLPSRNVDSFCYRLAEKCEFESLSRLKSDVGNYIKAS